MHLQKNLFATCYKICPMSYEEKIVGITFFLTALCWIFRKMINQIPAFAGLEDAVIAMIGGLSLFFVKSKDKENTLECGKI